MRDPGDGRHGTRVLQRRAHDAHAAWGDPDAKQQSSPLTANPRAIVETAAACPDRLRTRLPSAARACLVTRIAPATCPGALTTAADRSRTASAGKVVAAGRWTSRVSRVRRETHPEALQARRHRFATGGRACWLPTLIGAVGRGTRGAVLSGRTIAGGCVSHVMVTAGGHDPAGDGAVVVTRDLMAGLRRLNRRTGTIVSRQLDRSAEEA